MKKLVLVSIVGVFGFSEQASAASTDISTNKTGTYTLSSDGDTLTVDPGVTLSNTKKNVPVTMTGTGKTTLINNGTISQSGSVRAVLITGSGVALTVNNSGTISAAGNDAIGGGKNDAINADVTITNSGSITATDNQAINLGNVTAGKSLITNTGSITATGADALRLSYDGSVINAGTIESTDIPGSGSDGIDARSNSDAIITNQAGGIISGARHGITGGNTDTSTTGSYVMLITNDASAFITGKDGAGINIDGFNANEIVTVNNAGTITGNGITADGDGVDVDGIVALTNNSTGKIISTQANGDTSEGVTVGGGTINNYGLIEGENPGGASHGLTLAGVDKDPTTGNAIPIQGIYTDSTIHNYAGGTIKGDTGSGIAITGGATTHTVTIDNDAGATIEGGGSDAVIATGVTTTTINNSGIIRADGTGKAIDFGSGANDVLKITGGSAQVIGDIDGGTGNSTLIIAPGTGNSFTYNGTISDFSTVEIGPGTTALSGANTYTGGTQLTAGTLVAGNNAALGTGTLGMAAGTTLSFAAGGLNLANAIALNGDPTIEVDSGNATLSGTLSDGSMAGDLVKSGAGTLVLSGANTYTGGTQLTAGTLVAGNNAALGTGTLGMAAGTTLSFAAGGLNLANAIALNGDPTIEVDSGNATLSGTLSDGSMAGDLVKTGSGTLVLSGANTYTGGTEVSAGTLQVDGTLASPVAVDTNAMLSGTGTVGTTIVSGTLAPGDSGVGTLNVNGNLTLTSGSTYAVNVTPGAALSLVAVSGATTLEGGTVDVNGTGGNWRDAIVLLRSRQGVTGTFGTLVTNLAYLSPTLTYDADDVSLSFSRNAVAFGAVGITRNEVATGNGLGTLSSGALYDALVTASTASARKALNALSGEIHASARTALVQDSLYVRDAVTERLRAADCAPGAGSGAKTARIDGTRTDGTCRAEDAAVWMQGYGAFGHSGGDGNAASLTDNAGGFMLGLDAPVAGWHVGLAAGYGHSSFSSGTVSSWGHSDTVSVGPYAGTHWGRLGLRLGVTYSFNRLSTTRAVALPGYTTRLNANYNGGTTQAYGDLGYRLDMGRVSAEPFANVAWVGVRTGRFSEHGSSAALSDNTSITGASFATFGTRLAAHVRTGGVMLAPEATLAYRHGFGTLLPTAHQSFDGGSVFEVSGTPVTQDVALVKTGIRARLTDRLDLGADYVGQFSTRYTSNGVTGSIRVNF
ncbi:MAG: autotransporter domain-containing protein [Acetobacter sp.]